MTPPSQRHGPKPKKGLDPPVKAADSHTVRLVESRSRLAVVLLVLAVLVTPKTRSGTIPAKPPLGNDGGARNEEAAAEKGTGNDSESPFWGKVSTEAMGNLAAAWVVGLVASAIALAATTEVGEEPNWLSAGGFAILYIFLGVMASLMVGCVRGLLFHRPSPTGSARLWWLLGTLITGSMAIVQPSSFVIGYEGLVLSAIFATVTVIVFVAIGVGVQRRTWRLVLVLLLTMSLAASFLGALSLGVIFQRITQN